MAEQSTPTPPPQPDPQQAAADARAMDDFAQALAATSRTKR